MGVSRPIVKIDLSEVHSPEGKARVIKELMHAASDVGFFYLIGHGIPLDEINSMFALSEAFFKLPESVKNKTPFDASDGYKGFVSNNSMINSATGVPDLREAMSVVFPQKMKDAFPSDEDCPGFKEKTVDFMTKAHAVSQTVLRCFALGLGYEEEFFIPHHSKDAPDSMCNMRLIHSADLTGKTFPPGSFRCGAHCDLSTLTFLFQRPGECGLEVCPGREAVGDFATGSEWTPADPIEGAITVNIGDQLMWWSDDRLKSTFHRVRVPGPEEYQGARYSIGYFTVPNGTALIQGPSKKYPAMTGSEIMAYRAKIYADGGKVATDEELKNYGKTVPEL